MCKFICPQNLKSVSLFDWLVWKLVCFFITSLTNGLENKALSYSFLGGSEKPFLLHLLFSCLWFRSFSLAVRHLCLFPVSTLV